MNGSSWPNPAVDLLDAIIPSPDPLQTFELQLLLLQMNPIRLRSCLISLLLLAALVGLPVAAWFVSKNTFQLSTADAILAVLAALTLASGVAHLVEKYLDNGFARSFAEGGTWDFLVANFRVEKRPVEIEARGIFNGPCKLDREDILFGAECELSSAGIYINIIALDRLFIPWECVSVLRVHRIPVEGGWQKMVRITLERTEVNISIPWKDDLIDVVPQSIRVS